MYTLVCNSDTKRKDIVKLIKHIMIDDEIKNTQIAQEIGQTEASTSNLLNSKYRPDSSMTVDQLAAICKAMGYSLTICIDKLGE